jgi:hypothetical protein
MHNGNKQIKGYLNLERPQCSINGERSIRGEYTRQRGHKEVQKQKIGAKILPEACSKVLLRRQSADKT